MKPRLIAFILGILIVNSVIPGVVYASSWVLSLTPKNIRGMGPQGEAVFQTVEPVTSLTNPYNCGMTDFYAIRPENDPQMLLSILLTAYMTGKKIDIISEDTRCEIAGRPSVSNIRIHD